MTCLWESETKKRDVENGAHAIIGFIQNFENDRFRNYWLAIIDLRVAMVDRGNPKLILVDQESFWLHE